MLRKITIKQKIYFFAFLGIAISLGISYSSISAIKQIGTKLEQIANEDIPLTKAVSNITVHQLEQAIMFERAMRYGMTVPNASADKHYTKPRDYFKKLAKKVDAEILSAEHQAEEIIHHEKTHGGAPEVIAEFEHVLDVLKKIEKEHKDFDDHVYEAFALIEAGQHDQIQQLAEKIEQEEDNLSLIHI